MFAFRLSLMIRDHIWVIWLAKMKIWGLIQISLATGRIPYTFRFGGAHDGEHWLTKNAGAEVRATAGIKGTLLTHYNTSATEKGVFILLDNTKIVLVIKDLITLGPKMIKENFSNKENKSSSKIIDKNGNPISKTKLVNGDLIGTTMPWTNEKGAVRNQFYSAYAGYDPGTFHFAFVKYEFIQRFRSETTGVGGIAYDETWEQMEKAEQAKTAPLSWFVIPCSPESPVKCFK